MSKPSHDHENPFAVENEPVQDGDTPSTVLTKLPPLEKTKKRFSLISHDPLTVKEKVLFGIAIVFILAVGGGTWYWMQISSPFYSPGTGIVDITKKPVKYYSPLSGVEVADEKTTKRPVTAVMIENSDLARPQSGLAEAEVVFEAVAEGGITRFIALYQTNRPGLIGPVRSVRPYYLDWAAGFDPGVAHVGGSPDALSMIRSGDYGTDLDQFFNDNSYWRAIDREAPHNVYTNSDKLDGLQGEKGKTGSTYSFSPRIDERKPATPTVTRITADISSGIFNVAYDYDAATNSYKRSEGGAIHNDREKGQISPKVVVMMKTNIALSGDGVHMDVTTSGSGTADIFQNGTVIEGTWSKVGPKDKLYFKDASGKEISLVRGQTWITIVGNDRTITWQ